MKTGFLKWCPDQELNLDQRFRNPESAFRERAQKMRKHAVNRGDNADCGKKSVCPKRAPMGMRTVPFCSIELLLGAVPRIGAAGSI